MKRILLSILLVLSTHAYGGISIELQAGDLLNSSGGSMAHDNASPSNNGALLLLIVANGTNDQLQPGDAFVRGSDQILAAGGFNYNLGATNETDTFFQDPSDTTNIAGQNIQLRWFPSITFAQYKAAVQASNLNSLLTSSTPYGLYDPHGAKPDGGNFWTVPASGSILLNYFTLSAGGTQSNVNARASKTVTPVPEPSTFALLGLSTIGYAMLRRRRS